MASTGNMRSCFPNHKMTLSSSTPTTGATISTGPQQRTNMVTLTVRFAINAMISLNGLLLVLVSIVAHVVCALPLLTVILASASVAAALKA
jgi:hypothetical protein